ncbi:cytochrome P450 [Streptomyces sp. S186]|uniref:cytochrome P450 n=1 Tax=Streptomyces sp. S186 TaxID=3434395 RepID=UPI003F66C615
MPAQHGKGGRAFISGALREALVCPVSADSAGHRLISDYGEARHFLAGSAWSRVGVQVVPVGPASAMSLTEMGAPRHARFRGLLNSAFSARTVQARRPALERLAQALVARLRTAGGPAEAIGQFCRPFAFTTHCDVLGVPRPARPALYHWSLARSASADAGGREVHRAEVELHRTVRLVLGELHRRPGRGLLDLLIQKTGAGKLTERELEGLCASLFFDGHLLATAQLANALLCLLLHPTQLACLRAHPQHLHGAVEEALRYSPAHTVSVPRLATRSGHRAAVAFALANRDPRIFENPHRFDLTRTPNRHLAFGRGAHHCLGAELARLEVRIGLHTLLRELPGLRLAIDETALTWSVTPAIRTLGSLPIRWSEPRRARRPCSRVHRR